MASTHPLSSRAGRIELGKALHSRSDRLAIGTRSVFLAATAVGTLFYVIRFWTVFAAGELFHRLGFDWTMFYAQAMVIRAGTSAQMYQLAAIGAQLQALAPYSSDRSAFQPLPVPYPPWFAAVIIPFTFAPPPVAFGLWLLLSVSCAGLLAYRV